MPASTKTARKVLESVSSAKRVLLVLTRDEDINWVSARNLPHVHIIAPDQLSGRVYAITSNGAVQVRSPEADRAAR